MKPGARMQERPDNLAVRSSGFCFATCVCLSACGSGRLVKLLLRNACLSVCLQLESTRPVFASLASLSRVTRKSAPNRFPNRFSEGEKSMPRGPKIDARRAQNRPPGVQNRAKIALGAPVAPRRLPGAARSDPKTPKSAPKAPQEHPKSAQERPKSVPRAPQERPGWPRESSKGAPGSSRDPF